MKLKVKEFRFLLFFLPIYFCKLLNITPSNKWFVLLSIICFASLIYGFYKEKITRKIFYILIALTLYTGLMVFTCGKQGPFFSAMIILALHGIEDKRRIYKASFWVGIIAVLVSCYIERNGAIGVRYIGGEWTEVYKRSNILYISFVAVVSFYIFLIKEKKMKIWRLLAILFIGYAMYKYSGSRTGLGIIVLLVLMLFAFRFKVFQKSIIVRELCILSPLIMLIISCVLVWGYGKNNISMLFDNMLQGRIRQGSLYFDRYDISIFGQHLYHSYSSKDFWNLDCTYYYMLLGYGLIYTIVWLWFSCKLIKYLYDRNRFFEVTVMVIYAVYGITETFLPNGFLNASIFLYAEYLYHILGNRKQGVNAYENKNYSYVPTTVSRNG